MSAYKICILPGDHIGPEVIKEAVRVLEVVPIDFEFIYGDIGWGAYEKHGKPLPDDTRMKFESADAALFGAVTTPPNVENYSSPVLQLRRDYDLYVNLRPCYNDNIDLVIVRENTEGMYSGIERVEDNGNRAITERVITRKGSERIIKYAFELARTRVRKKLTVVHKANVLRETCGLFRKVALELAEKYPDVQMEEFLVDRCAMELIRKPEYFDVIVTTNLFGDILSDEAAMLTGGLGIAHSGNIGDERAMFEPVHGSAPIKAGKNTSNPIATILAAKLMLEHLGEKDEAKRIEIAVQETIAEKKVTADLGGSLSTTEVADNIIKLLTK